MKVGGNALHLCISFHKCKEYKLSVVITLFVAWKDFRQQNSVTVINLNLIILYVVLYMFSTC